MNKVPNPGSDEAIKQGCTCPVLDNEHGLGILGLGKDFVIFENCPLHGKRKPSDPLQDQFARAIKRHKHTQAQVARMFGVAPSSISNMIHYKADDLLERLRAKVRIYIKYGSLIKTSKPTQSDVKLPDYRMSKKIDIKMPTTPAPYVFKPTDKVHYIRDENYQPIGCLIATLTDIGQINNIQPVQMVTIGVSMCNTKHDKFNKLIGRTLALIKAKEYWKESRFPNKELEGCNCLAKELDNFIGRCVSFYKDKNIILPKIAFT